MPVSAAAQAHHHGTAPVTESATAKREKQEVLNLLSAYRTGDQAAFKVINPKKFIQHDPAVADGVAGLRSWLTAAPKGKISVHPVRVLVDGSYVAVHSETDLPTGTTVSFDVFRFEQGRIVEHWDSRQAVTAPNASGHTELDGATTVKDLGKTRYDKARVDTGMQEVFVQRQLSKFGEPIWSSKEYRQHHYGDVQDGVAGAKPVLDAVADGSLAYTKINKVLGEGNFVLTIGQGTVQGTPTAYYDLFRLDKGKIVEHWDVLTPLTAPAQAKNANGEFDFPQDQLSTNAS
ncbi:conserved hypothetical protein [Streptomyces sviceus ATCC 29083]|uniref:SnoaL-like domain-containing protein n=1 Tax=Streptomyces sviceus (strain ATCC 29083 / DSM 924 / JCM 4929 / NBRC 13980 / NCIMB 11184 / NRRL 5439 / UC 5370) TaxID=463191 RepID=B5HUS3_STRX2|nr:conserved hypothetical protein [Streptomyces sviceus ATCC 29083]